MWCDFVGQMEMARERQEGLIQQGLSLQQQGRVAEAQACYRRVLETDPQDVDANNLLSVLKAHEGKWEEALRHIEVAFHRAPTSALVLLNYGNILGEIGRELEALARFDQALAINPQLSSLWINRGSILKRLRRYDEAVASYQRAITLNPNEADTHYNLGLALHHQGQHGRAGECFDRALELSPGFLRASVARCMAELPVLYADEAEIDRRRAAYGVRLKSLALGAVQNPREIANAIEAIPPFFLPYQGRNDRDLQALYGAIVCRAMAQNMPLPEHLAHAASPGERVRVGIVSGFFRSHSNWKIPIKGWVSQLDRRRFQLFGYHTDSLQDNETQVARRMFDRFVQGPLPMHAWRDAILADRPHVLIYPEIGMAPRSLLLAAQRLAPVQCNSWGHPVTSGFPTIDYYLSSELMEPTDAEHYYTEKLIRLPNLSIYYEPVEVAPVSFSRETLGLRQGVPTYWSGQSLYKYLPQHDHVFARVASGVGDCQFVFIDYPGEEANGLFRRRLAHAFGAVGLNSEEYCVFLKLMPPEQFLAAIGQCDIFLDSIGWSGCNSTLESLAHDLPIVTMPGPMMRGRHSMAILKMMGQIDTIASTTEEYIAHAVRLGLDLEWRSNVRDATRRSKHRVYRDQACIAAFQDFLEGAARGNRPAPEQRPFRFPSAALKSGMKSSVQSDPAQPQMAHITLETTGIERRFYFRQGTTDQDVIHKVFQQHQYALHNLRRWPYLLNLIARNAGEGRRPLVVDAGANIGASTVYFAIKIPGASVVAIEPAASNVGVLRQNVDGLDVEVICAAISSHAGASKIIAPGLGHWGMRTEAAPQGGGDVANITIPELLGSREAGLFPFLIKIDIEGAKKEVFSANTEWIPRTAVIMVELHDRLLPNQGTALPFLQAVQQCDRDFILSGETVVSIANSL